MERTHWMWMVAAALILGVSSSCATTVDEGTEALVIPGEDMHVQLDGGPPPDDVEPSEDEMPSEPTKPQTDDTTPFDVCHDVTCADGEACCPATGQCFPEECRDCCYAINAPMPDVGSPAVGTHTGPDDSPAFGGPEPPRVMPDSLPDPPGPKPNE